MALTIKQISEAVGISRLRVDQWISRGHFRTPDKPTVGKARDWGVTDVMRLVLMDRLLDHNLTADVAGRLVLNAPYGFRNDAAFFVAWSGVHDTAMEGVRSHVPGHLFSEIVEGTKLSDFLRNPDVEYAIVINLDTLATSVETDLKKIGFEEEKTAW